MIVGGLIFSPWRQQCSTTSSHSSIASQHHISFTPWTTRSASSRMWASSGRLANFWKGSICKAMNWTKWKWYKKIYTNMKLKDTQARISKITFATTNVCSLQNKQYLELSSCLWTHTFSHQVAWTSATSNSEDAVVTAPHNSHKLDLLMQETHLDKCDDDECTASHNWAHLVTHDMASNENSLVLALHCTSRSQERLRRQLQYMRQHWKRSCITEMWCLQTWPPHCIMFFSK